MRLSLFILWLCLVIIDGQVDESCPQLSNVQWLSIGQCYSIGRICRLRVFNDKTATTNYRIELQSERNLSSLILSKEFSYEINRDYLHDQIIIKSSINSTILRTDHCERESTSRFLTRRNLRQSHRSGSSSTIITFNSSSFIDYRSEHFLDYPLRLSVRFRTIGRITTGVLLSFAYHKSNTSTIPCIIIEHTQSKIEMTILQLDERDGLSTVTTIPCGKNVNNDQWHWLQFEIDQHGVFTIVVDDESRTSQIPSYVVSSWKINALLVGDTRRLTDDIFQPFLGYMSDLIFNDEHLFSILTTTKVSSQRSSFRPNIHHILIGYRIAFFNLLTIETQTSYIAFSERENQQKNVGKFDIYFLFRTLMPDGIILYRYAQGLNEYFAIGLRAGILTLFVDFGFGKRQILSDESMKLADGKWHEVRVTRLGLDKIELAVDNRVNRSILSSNGIRNAVALQPVLYVGGIPMNNPINFTGSTLNALGFQGCLASFLVDGRALDYQRALVSHGQMKLNVCSDLNKLCYDFTCIHSGICKSNEVHGVQCDCTDTGYIGERCDKLPNGFYFGKSNDFATLEYPIIGRRATEQDTITFGLQTLAISGQIFRLESDSNRSSLEYEIVRGRSYIKLNLGEKYAEIFSGVAHINDGFYHVIKIHRHANSIQMFVDGIRIELDGGNKFTEQVPGRSLLFLPRRLRLGHFHNGSKWNGILAGLSYNHQLIFEHFSSTLIKSGDLEEVYPDEYTGQFKLFDSIYSSSTTTPIVRSSTSTTIPTTTTTTTTTSQSVLSVNTTIIFAKPLAKRSKLIRWIEQTTKNFSSRSLIVSSLIAISFLLFIIFILLRSHCTNRQTERKSASNCGNNYSQLNHQSKRCSVGQQTDGRLSKKRVPKLLRYLHTNETKPTSFRLSNHRADSYQLITPIQDQKVLPYRNSDCVLNEHCCIHSSLSQPTPSSNSSLYHQVNRLMLSGSDPPLPLPHHSTPPPLPLATTIPNPNPNPNLSLRSLRKDIDNSSAQTYSAVYSCDLAANLDMDQESFHKRLAVKRRSILKTPHSTILQTKLLFLYSKSLVDAYALQKKTRSNQQNGILLAIAEENRLQFFHAVSGSFHCQLTIPSVGSCHNLFYSSNGQYLIGLFYEVTSNVNPYSVKICSTDDMTIRSNPHPIKCSVALPSDLSSTLYMAGKQKYGRGISLGLLDLETSTLVRELKSDPDTSIGDEIRRILLSQNESYVLVACTEHTSTFTCFVIFKLEPLNDEAKKSLSNCTMILTRFDCDPNHTFSLNDSTVDQQMLTILRSNEILIWQLSDGEILSTYDFHHHNPDEKIQPILQCQLYENRLFILIESGLIEIFSITHALDEQCYLTTISDPSISCLHWLDQRHFLSLDNDGQRFRTWNIERHEVINQSYSHQGTIQNFHLHSTVNEENRREYLLLGSSQHERSLFLFEYTPSM